MIPDMVGRYFLTLDADSAASLQGVVTEAVPPAGVMVGFFSWCSGAITHEEMIPTDELDAIRGQRTVWFRTKDQFEAYVANNHARWDRIDDAGSSA